MAYLVNILNSLHQRWDLSLLSLQCKIFVQWCNFVLLSLKLLELGEIDSVKVLAWNSSSVKFGTNLMSASHFWLLLQWVPNIPIWNCGFYWPGWRKLQFEIVEKVGGATSWRLAGLVPSVVCCVATPILFIMKVYLLLILTSTCKKNTQFLQSYKCSLRESP